MGVNIKVFCVHNDEPEDESTGYNPSYEMVADPVEYPEISLTCPKCRHEIFITFESQLSGEKTQ